MFVRGGDVYPGGDLNNAGGFGGYWSSVGRSSSDAYYLVLLTGLVYPSRTVDRYYGQSVRCVALGG